MDEKRFWDIIAVGCPHEADEGVWDEGLHRELCRLDPEDIVAFDILFDRKAEAAYQPDLVAACNAFNGGASDDGFCYFRLWLVGMGKRIYEAAVADADTLADVPLRADLDAEAELYGAARAAWREGLGRTEEEFDELYKALVPAPLPAPPYVRWQFHDNAEFRRRLPRIAARFLTEDDE